MSWPMVPLGEMMAKKNRAVDPRRFPDEAFDLYSIPAHDHEGFETRLGSQIGSPKMPVEPGDVVVSKIVPHIRRSRVIDDFSGRTQLASGEWIIFRSGHFHAQYLKHFLLSDRFHAQFMTTVAGVGGSLLRARPSEVARICVPLPPLADQRRIASILDQADALRTKRRQVLAHLDTLSQSIFHDMFGEIAWTARLQDMATVQTGPFGSLLHADDYVTDGIPVINPIHIQGSEIQPDSGFSVSREKATSLRQFLGNPGDIFLGRRGEMGRAGMVPEELSKRGVLCGTGCLIIRPSVNSNFLHAVLVSKRMRNYLEREALGVTLPNLNSEIVLRAPVPAAPPRQLQSSFVRRLAAVDSLRSQVESCSSELAELFTSLQSRAFTGEL